MVDSSVDVLKRRSLWLGGLTGTIALLVGAMIALPYFVLPVLDAGRPGYPPQAEILPGSLVSLAYWSPALFYLAALALLARMFGRVAAGRSIWRETIRGLGSTGIALMLGAAMTVLVQPWLMQLHAVREIMVRQDRHGVIGGWINLDVPAITIGVVGLALLLLGGLLHRAEMIQTELDEII